MQNSTLKKEVEELKEEIELLQEALDNIEAQLEMIDYVADKWNAGDILESIHTVENFHDGV